MMKTIVPFVLFLSTLFGQTSAPITPPGTANQTQVASQTPQLNDVWAAMGKLSNVAPAAYILSSVANSSTNWNFQGPITGRTYNISAVQATSITGAVIGVALVVRYLWPKTGKYINAGLLIGAGALAGSAYAHTLNHGTVAAK